MTEPRRRVLRLLLKLNNLPNTLIGALLGLAGVPFGARVSAGNNALQFLGHSLMRRGSAVTIGNVVLYGRSVTPLCVGFDGNRLSDHEHQHTIQGERLGVFYLPLHLLSGLAGVILNGDWYGPANWNERGPQRHPPRPW
jgi:hypothetical protein